MKKARKNDTVLLFSAGTLLFLGGLSLLLFPAPRFSATENRLLAESPPFSLASLADGSYTAAWERYAAERVGGRRLMRGVHARAELLLGKQQTSEVLVCRDGSLTKRLCINERIYQKNLSGIKKLQDNAASEGLLLDIAVAPRRMDACTSVLPPLFCPDGSAYESLPTHTTVLSASEDGTWYRTDHHWTTKGAYAAYALLGERLGFTPYSEQDFSRITVSDHFRGTSDAAAGLPDVAPDKIELWRYKGDEALTLTKDGKSAPFTGFYDLDKLNTRDGYAVFLGGNDGITEISLSIEDTRPTLLIFKDSFANSVIPFLARHYRIVAVDPRYTKIDPSSLFAKADKALLLMGMQTLSEIAIF